MKFYAVYTADVLDAVRAMGARVTRRKSAAVWFALLFAGSVWLALRLAEVALTFGLPPTLEVTPGTLLFMAFFATLGKGAVDAYHRAIRPESLVFLLAQPVPRPAVALGKFFALLWFNLAFLAGALALAVAFIAIGRMRVPLPWEFGAALILAAVSGLASGFTLAVLGSLATWRRKALALAAYSPVIGAAYLLLGSANPTPGVALVGLAGLAPVSLASVFASSRFLIEAWNNQSAGRRRAGEPRSYVRLPDPQMGALVDAELKTMVRRRQLALSLATIAVLGVALLVLYGIVGPPSGMPRRFARLFYPIVVAMAVYVAASTQLAVPGMAALGKELDRLWILRSHPVAGKTVYGAKSLAVLFAVPAILVGVALPLPIIAGFPASVTAFILLVSFAACLALTAFGIYAGGKHPNFDPNTQGLPDSLELYNAFLVALVLAFVIVAVPAQVYQFDVVLGFLGAILAADLAVLLVIRSAEGAARRYDRIEA